MIFKLQPNSFKKNKDDYITIKLYYKRKLSIAIIENGKNTIKTISDN